MAIDTTEPAERKGQPSVSIELQHVRLTGKTRIALLSEPSDDADRLGWLQPGAICIAFAEVRTDAERWHRVQHSVLGSGYVRTSLLSPMSAALLGVGDGVEQG